LVQVCLKREEDKQTDRQTDRQIDLIFLQGPN
jgi:hypothetical protein